MALSPTGLAERLRDDVAALVLIAPAGFGRIHLAEAIQLPGVRSLVRHGLPLALVNPVTALGVYMAVVGNGHLPDPELVARLRKNAYRWAPGAECANEAITASGRSRRAFYRRQLDYHGPVLALWGDRDRLVPLAHRDGVMTAFPQAQVSVWKKMGHHPQRERPSELAQFIEAACGAPVPSARGAASSGKPRRRRVLAVRAHAAAAGGRRGRVAGRRLAITLRWAAAISGPRKVAAPHANFRMCPHDSGTGSSVEREARCEPAWSGRLGGSCDGQDRKPTAGAGDA